MTSVFKILLVSMFAGSAALAAPAPIKSDGYYSGRFADGAKAAVFLRRLEGDVIYGFILRKEGSGRSASVYRVEELEDGTQSWVGLIQTAENVLSAVPDLEATYTAQAEQGGRIRLTPTENGRKMGCAEEVTGKYSRKNIWVNIPPNGVAFKDSTGVLYPRTLTGSFKLDGVTYQGPFSLTPLAPGMALLRAQAVSAEAADGKELKKEITAVVTTVYVFDTSFHFFDDNKYEVNLIRLTPGEARCSYPRVLYKQE